MKSFNRKTTSHNFTAQKFIRIGIGCCVLFLFFQCRAPIWERVDLNKRAGAPIEAERALLAHLETHPGDAKAYFLLGETRAQLEKWQEMMDAFEKCERLNIDWRRDIFARKNLYWRQNFQNGLDALKNEAILRARNLFESCMLIFPTRARGFRLFGETSLMLGDTTAAINAFAYTLRINDEDYRARRFLMSTYFYSGQYKEAILHANHILSKKKNDLEALRVKAYSYGLLKQREEANQAYMALLNPQIPHLIEDYINYAGYKYSMGLYDDAAKSLRQAIEHGADKVENLEAIMQTHLMQQDYVDLFETAKELLEEDSTRIKALQLKQIALLAMKQHEQASDAELTYLITLSTLRLALKDYAEVIKNTSEVLRQDSLNIRAYELRIAALDSMGNNREARINEMEMLHIKSDKFEERNNYQQVVAMNKRILEINPIDFEAMQQKNAAHRALGDSSAAAQTRIAYHLALLEQHKAQKDHLNLLKDALNILLIDDKNLTALETKWLAYDSLGNRRQALKSKFNYLQELAETQFASQKYKDLVETTTQIIAMDSTNVRANNLKRDSYLGLNNKEAAEATQLQYFEAIANELLRQENYTALVEKVDEILGIQPTNLNALKLRATAYTELQDSVKARQARLNYFVERARRQSRNKLPEDLLTSSNEILTLDDTNLIGLQFRYMALQDLSRKSEAEQAEQAYLHALALNYNQQQAWAKLLETSTKLLEFNQLDSAAVSLKERAYLKRKQPNMAKQTRLDYFEKLCNHHMGAKRYDDVISTTVKMLDISTNYIPALKLRKDAFYSKGNWEVASKIEDQINQLSTK
ncbi:MAG: hypothetical protein DWQ10_16330 [Calditrichaeota bacterium]|nr:MAG: hypothetical protein DWQ10_16330 [Calditrichota bacterium]